jgi:tRNA-specific 2-thiouridylase
MSGGVDSSVAAARLARQGLEVVGVTLHLWDYADDAAQHGRCCAPEDIHNARRVADFLGIAHYAFDRRELFRRSVVEPFVDGYLRGETPSPCVGCNRRVKLAELFRLAERLGAEAVATGHYARIEWAEGRPRLLRGVDRSKDQSYFLHPLSGKELGQLRFPLGSSTKAEVRAEALELGLPGATKGESQELCFVPTGRYDAFVAECAGDRLRPGPILDGQGRQVGTHRGIQGFTVGQRKNLGVALGERVYVVGIEPDTATVRLGPREALLAQGAALTDVTLPADPSLPLGCEVAVRYRAPAVAAELTAAPGGGYEVRFDEPVQAVVPGQHAVFYRAERVLGGGKIQRALGVAS